MFDARQGTYASLLNQWFFGIGCTVITFLVSVPISMMSEVPFMNIEKYILFPEKKKDIEIRKKNEEKEFGQLKPLIHKSEEESHNNSNDKTMETFKK